MDQTLDQAEPARFGLLAPLLWSVDVWLLIALAVRALI